MNNQLNRDEILGILGISHAIPWFVTGKNLDQVKVQTLAFVNFLKYLGFVVITINGERQYARVENNIVMLFEKLRIMPFAKEWFDENF